MSNETTAVDLLKLMKTLDSDTSTNKITLAMTCLTTVIVTLKPLFYHWVDAKYGRNGVRTNENGDPVKERELPLSNEEPPPSTSSNANVPAAANASTTNNGVIIYQMPTNQQPLNDKNKFDHSFGASDSSSLGDGNDSQNL